MPHQQLFDKLFGEVADTERPELLQKLIEQYPYFSAPHYFLLKETDPEYPEYNSIAAKTALHYNNPFFLNYLLNYNTRLKKLAPVVSMSAVSNIAESAPAESTPPEINKRDLVITQDNPSTGTTAEEIKSSVTEELVFEPLYTTDYFASQGIKLVDEAQPTDKLGKQLKSFTEWLKTMKKVHAGKLPSADESVDAAVQHLAEKSNKEDEILTESMADVFMQHGKHRKAREIYEKLSLLNPAKSAYFAAKIKNLKES